MPRYLLDANVVIDWLKGKEPALGLVRHLVQSLQPPAVNAVTLAEVHSGVSDDDRETVDRLLTNFEYWEIDEPVARLAGRYRYGYARQGRPFALTDMLMAAHAVQRDATLVTDNVRDFPMPEVRLRRPDPTRDIIP